MRLPLLCLRTSTHTSRRVGRERLKDSLEQRSGALQLLVQAEWDRFVGIKGATECESSSSDASATA